MAFDDRRGYYRIQQSKGELKNLNGLPEKIENLMYRQCEVIDV
jgi:hypothetical protein